MFAVAWYASLHACSLVDTPDVVACTARGGEGTAYAHPPWDETHLGFSGQDVLDTLQPRTVVLDWSDGTESAHGTLDIAMVGDLPVVAWDSPWPEACASQLEIATRITVSSWDGALFEWQEGWLTARALENAWFWGRGAPLAAGDLDYASIDPGFDPERSSLVLSVGIEDVQLSGSLELTRYDAAVDAHLDFEIATFRDAD